MTTLRTAAQQALEALEAGPDVDPIVAGEAEEALRAELAEPVLVESALQSVAEKIGDQYAVWYGIGARDVEAVLREAVRHGLVHGALAEPVQEPVQCSNTFACRCPKHYTASPQRKPLTEEEIQAAWDSVDMRHPRGNETRIAFARAVERAHEIGGQP